MVHASVFSHILISVPFISNIKSSSSQKYATPMLGLSLRISFFVAINSRRGGSDQDGINLNDVKTTKQVTLVKGSGH